MTQQLPTGPNFSQQTETLLKDRNTQNEDAIQRIRNHHPQFANATDEEVLAGKFSLRDAQLVLASEYGFDNWAALKARCFLQMLPGFLEAVRNDDLKRAGSLLDDFPEYANASAQGSSVYLDYEAMKQQSERTFKGGHWNEATYQGHIDPAHSTTPLCYCAVHGRSAMATLLLSHKGDLNRRGYDENHGEALPLTLAAWEGDVDTVKVLLQYGADSNADDGAAMKTALGHRSFDKCKALLEGGFRVDVETAAGLGLTDELKSLLEVGHSSEGALVVAACQNEVEALKVILEHDPNPDLNSTTGWAGMSALQQAAYYGAAEAVVCLIQAGADVNIIKAKSMYRWDTSGSALHIAVNSRMGEFEAAFAVIKVLLEAGVDTSVSNADGKTAAELADDDGNDEGAALIRNYVVKDS